MDSPQLVKDLRSGLKNLHMTLIVLEVSAPTTTKENREVRSCKVADHTGCVNISIWDEPGQFVQPGDIIRLTKGYASFWRNCLTLYCSKAGDIQKIGEYCMIFSEQPNMSEPNPTLAAQLAVQNQNQGKSSSLNSISGGVNNGNTSNGPPVARNVSATVTSAHASSSTSQNSTPAAKSGPRFGGNANEPTSGRKSPTKGGQRGRGGPRGAPRGAVDRR